MPARHHKRFTLLLVSLALASCSGAPGTLPIGSATRTAPAHAAGVAPAAPHALQAHAVIGFSVDTPQRAANAGREGVNTTILYDGSPAPQSALEKALSAHSIEVVDAAVSSILFYWECHRTHTVAPPPGSYSYNSYCRTDEDPRIDSDSVVLHNVDEILERDAKRPYVVGYWVLDDWPSWDAGSARTLLQKIHTEIENITPRNPAICGFGAGIGRPGKVDWFAGTADNYSNGGCDIVGWYVYSSFGRHHPSRGEQLDWSMKALLPAMRQSLAKFGWNMPATPLYGIGQAWAGSYDRRFYQPGLSVKEMRDQAAGFCNFGAQYVGWYAWDDSADNKRTRTPNNSKTIANGIAAGIAACGTAWK